MNKFALVSVYDKTGLLPLVQSICASGFNILSTGGTAAYLKDNGIEVTLLSDYTGQDEILDGRVKTLHPKIHGGILSRRGNPADMQELEKQGIALIDFVVVNLYPFVDKVTEIENGKVISHDSLVEFIDIGGPTMLRAAAKNCSYVVPVCDQEDYSDIIKYLNQKLDVPLELRQRLASKVFSTMAAYDGAVARYFSLNERLLEDSGEAKQLASVENFTFEKHIELRYGENPHQKAAWYKSVRVGSREEIKLWELLQGKQLSYNNLLDVDASLDLFLEFMPSLNNEQVSVIIKHTNPCGVAIAESPHMAFINARLCDPLSAFGGIVAVSGILDKECASVILEGFVEVVLAGEFTSEALQMFSKKKNIRVIRCDLSNNGELFRANKLTFKRALDGYLIQQADYQLSLINKGEVVSGEKPSEEQLKELDFAWKVCKHTKSNAIVIVKKLQSIGVGAGQMSRVDAARIAIQRAIANGHLLDGAVAASDAFLPFADTLQILHDAGIKALVQPGGSIKDKEVIEEAKRMGMLMIFTGERHFRH
jgi:phosphoribosylaminoimidazolecarboxamide formyltransferase / IMP cyclohydrolase